jgi:hypothetical protein
MAMLFLHARIPVRWLMFMAGTQARPAVICQETGYAEDYLIVLRTYSAKNRRWQGLARYPGQESENIPWFLAA